MRMPRVRFTVRRMMAVIVVVAFLLAGFLGTVGHVHQIGWTAHRRYLRGEWTEADRREHGYREKARSASKRGDLVGAASFRNESDAAAEQTRELQSLLREVQRYLGEPPENALGPAQPKL